MTLDELIDTLLKLAHEYDCGDLPVEHACGCGGGIATAAIEYDAVAPNGVVILRDG